MQLQLPQTSKKSNPPEILCSHKQTGYCIITLYSLQQSDIERVFPQESISRTPDVQDGQAMLTSLDNNNKMASIKKENGSEDPIGEF